MNGEARLEEEEVTTMTNKKCRGIYSNVTDHMLCAETDSIRGTGGGGGRGLVVKPDRTELPYLLIGIESWGEMSGLPRVFTRLTSLMSWVYQVTSLSGFIITGGYTSDARNSVELFNPRTNRTCKLRDLPMKKLTLTTFGHTDCSSMICRDGSCRKRITLDSYSESTVRLQIKRSAHLCWPLPGDEGKVMLLGGAFSPKTTEIVLADGSLSTERKWNLTQRTRLVARNVSYHQLRSPPQPQLWGPGRDQVDSVWRSVCLHTGLWAPGREESVRL